MTELSFLLDLLLNHKLPKPTREALTARIKDVEARLSAGSPAQVYVPPPLPQMLGGVPQAASTLAAMARHAQVSVVTPDGQVTPPPPIASAAIPQPVAIVAQTPAAVAAMNHRQESLGLAMSGKPAKGETRPRKF